MGQIVEEVRQWNTPIVGAFLLWEFTQGYCRDHPHGDAPVVLLHFLAAAILTNRKLSEPISNRRKNLQSYVRSFEENKSSDLLFGVQQRILDKREYTIAAIDVAISQGLLVWDVESGKLYSHDITKRPSKGNALRSLARKDGEKAQILGSWFAQHDLSIIAEYMKVVF